MKAQSESSLDQRETIIELLSDDEVSKVSTAETAVRLAEGDEFLDLEQLGLSVQRADGVPVHIEGVLPRKVVHELTWIRILELLVKSGPKS